MSKTTDKPESPDFEALKQAFDDLGQAGQMLLNAVRAGAEAFAAVVKAAADEADKKTTESDT